MRPLLACAVFAALMPGLAGAASAPFCALPSPQPVPVADREAAATAPPASAHPATAAPAAAVPLPDSLAAVPFVKHVTSAGAAVSFLGDTHGLASIAARSDDQFMIFAVTPDGQAGISGAMIDLTLAQLTSVAHGSITELSVQHGLRGFFVRSGAQFQVFYATPDEQRLIPGVLWDADGRNLTRQQVANVPGAIPTVVVGDADSGAVPAAGATAVPVAALPLVQKANVGTIGSASAPHLWMLIDPQCIYSVRALQMLQPYAASGRLQVSVIPIAVLDHEDSGQSTRSALALLSKPADQLVSAWQAGAVTGTPSPEAAERLRANMAIAEAIRLQGTPTFVWRKRDGSEGRFEGIPTSVDALVTSVGG